MVNAEPSTIATLVTVTVSVMAFFTVSATRYVKELKSDIHKVVASLAVMNSYVLLFLVGLVMIGSEVFRDMPALFGGLKIIFVAFFIPGFILVWKPLGDILMSSVKSLDAREKLYASAWIVFFAIIYVGTIVGWQHPMAT